MSDVKLENAETEFEKSPKIETSSETVIEPEKSPEVSHDLAHDAQSALYKQLLIVGVFVLMIVGAVLFVWNLFAWSDGDAWDQDDSQRQVQEQPQADSQAQARLQNTDTNIGLETAKGELAQDWLEERVVTRVTVSTNSIINLVINDIIFDRGDVVYDDAGVQLRKLCVDYQSICQIISIKGSYSPSHRLRLYAVSVYIIDSLNNFMVVGTPFDEMMTELAFGTGDIQENCWHTAKGCSDGFLLFINTDKIDQPKELFETLTHEFGHVFDLGLIDGDDQELSQEYTEFAQARFSASDWSLRYYKLSRADETTRHDDSVDADFCSFYGTTNPFEDYAECFNLRINNNRTFETIAQNSDILKQKYRYFSSLFGGEYLFPNLQDKESFVSDGKQLLDTSLRQ